jgi:hypothetical protein
MVTDPDVGVEGAGPVTADEVVCFRENNERLRELLFAVIPRIGAQPEDAARRPSPPPESRTNERVGWRRFSRYGCDTKAPRPPRTFPALT